MGQEEHTPPRIDHSQAKAETAARIIAILSSSTEQDMFADVLDLILATFRSRFGFFGYLDEDTGALVCPSMTREIFSMCQVEGKSVVFPRDLWGGLWGRVLLERKCLRKNEEHRVPEGHIPLHRSLGAPILYQGRLLGSLHVANRGDDYTEADAEVMQSIAALIAPVLEARMQRDKHEQMRRQAEEALEKRAQDLASSNAELERVNRELERLISRQRQELEDLSTPVIEVWAGVLVAPLVGALDQSRMSRFMSRLLEEIVRSRASVVLVDITGLPSVDTDTARHLFGTTAAVKLLGARVVLTGIRPEIAQTVIGLDVDLSGIITRSSLASGLELAFHELRLRVVRT